MEWRSARARLISGLALRPAKSPVVSLTVASGFTGQCDTARHSRAFNQIGTFAPYRAGALTDDSGDAPDGPNRKCEA